MHVLLVHSRFPATYWGFQYSLPLIDKRAQGEPEPNWALLGAIVKTPVAAHFFKLTGPKKSVEDARVEFDALVDSFRPKPAAAPSASGQ